MANTTTDPNMGFLIPVVSAQTGPEYATNINNSLTTIGAHDHSPGSGVLINPDGLDINSDLTIGNNNLTNVRSTRFMVNGVPLGSTDVGAVYVAGVDLYYNDTAGTEIRLTQSGGVAGTPGSITNLASPASATWVSASSAFVWQSNTNVAANLDARSVIFRNATASSFGATVSAPAALSGNYDLTLPLAPAAKSFMTIDTAGTIVGEVAFSAGITGAMVAPRTIAAGNIVGSSITNSEIANKTITTTQIADRTVTGSNTATNTIARVNLTSLGQQTNSLNTVVPSGSVSMVLTLATSGRPVMCMLYGGSGGKMVGTSSFVIAIRENAATIGGWTFPGGTQTSSPVIGFGTASAGNNVYDVSFTGASAVEFTNMLFTVYEL